MQIAGWNPSPSARPNARILDSDFPGANNGANDNGRDLTRIWRGSSRSWERISCEIQVVATGRLPERRKPAARRRGGDDKREGTGRENVSTSATSLARWKLLIPSKVLNHISHGEARASEERFEDDGEGEEGEKGERNVAVAGSEGDLDLGSWKPFFLRGRRARADPAGDIYGSGNHSSASPPERGAGMPSLNAASALSGNFDFANNVRFSAPAGSSLWFRVMNLGEPQENSRDE
ncbi:hypothetical protein DBV15_09969 [Temnothorax longispinosus]|uniref:Uncharacterized protein n=1 Tax=Temnothorax longispinosus TaxID=300112 RepID=A0A4S2KFL7_9HYME|nr:hypothetical protein DBV15_09969 [Temnothorax longispinosus]